MKGYKEPNPIERQSASSGRKKAALDKFRAHIADPELTQRLAQRSTDQATRTELKHADRARRAEDAAKAAQLAKQAAEAAAEKEARDLAQEQAARLADEADQKKARDLRYAARKARGRR